ncbi:alpha/beta fold hydrolase [Falsirhodobacter sp. 20TX0035]|uniref:alpha/beta fold hydrolase n=1 Tax=Falsirhodobacter sp. 20TX0035 TaxID=3022019 RepID=UPI00232BD31F|nr:hypothetical protein [Falsirhodobacter sp. 20TX0035]MDB6452641.1 hypothetical protein [Falsirhodobacter sp. 20TX0035]
MDGSEIVFQGSCLRAIGTALDRPRTLVTFDHRERGKADFPAYRCVNRALNHGMGHLSISTAANDWFLNPETEMLRAALRRFATDRTVRAIGFSMGGYGAMLFAGDLRLERMVLVAPQYSIFPEHWPHDPRYAPYAVPLDARLDRIPPAEGEGPAGLVLYDPRLQPFDRKHAAGVCRHFPRLRPVALPFGGHPPLQNFERGVGSARILGALLTDRLTPALVRGFHREVRVTSERYQRRLSKYLAARAARGADGTPPPPVRRPAA